MSSNRASEEQILATEQLARAVVEAVAPSELALFKGLARRYREDPRVIDRLRSGRAGRLDFGSDEQVPIVTLVILLLLHRSVAPFLAANLPQRGGDEEEPGRDTPALLPSLTPQQFEEMRAQVRAAAMPYGADQASAETVADAIVEHIRELGPQQLQDLSGRGDVSPPSAG